MPALLGPGAALSIGLNAVIVAATAQDPRVLTIRYGPDAIEGEIEGAIEALLAGPLEAEHRTLEIGLRAWVERQTSQKLGYVEQLYTFGDRDRMASGDDAGVRALTVAYLALVREARPAGSADAAWQSWYRYFPWEDWRDGKPALLGPIEERLEEWAAAAATEPERRLRAERLGLAFGLPAGSWNEELVLERYELLYQAGLVAEAARDLARPAVAGDTSVSGVAMALDHRRILATAIGRLRGKIKYRPVVFELMPAEFTLLQLQRSVEALAGRLVHKQNFRRLIEQQQLVEETGAIAADTVGRPAKLFRFRHAVLAERAVVGTKLPLSRS